MTERKSHVVRIKGKQKVEGGDPETLDDVWADVRRTDELPLSDLGDGQGRILFVAWDDDFTGDPPEDDDRIERIIKLTDPENPPDDLDDPDIYIPIPVLDQVSVLDADQKIILQFANKRVEDDGDETLREVRVKRITHADTDPAEMPDPIDAENYSRLSDTVDETQYIDHEVIDSSPHFDVGQEHRLIYGADDDDLMNSFSSRPADAENKPIRLDLFQNIVNVQWQSQMEIIISWTSGGCTINPDLPGSIETPRIRYYKTIFGSPAENGSFPSPLGGPGHGIPNLFGDSPSASDPSAAQTAAIAALVSAGRFIGSQGMGGTVYAATLDEIVSIDRRGAVKVIAGISLDDIVGADWSTDPDFADPLWVYHTLSIVVVPGAVAVGFEKAGSSVQYGDVLEIPDEEPFPDPNRATLGIVGYFCFDLNGNLLAQEVIDGPDIGAQEHEFVDNTIWHTYTTAFAMTIQAGRFE